MVSARQLASAVGNVPTVEVQGLYYRFVSQRRIDSAMAGSTRGGRWGPADQFPVLYLADDQDACTIEAYRHSTDAEDPTGPPVNLALVACSVAVTNIVDLTSAGARWSVGLADPAILFSEPQGLGGAAYRACAQVAQAAHQVGRHGLLVPSATQRGNTLALFTDLLPEAERPEIDGHPASWERLPADPRRLRLVTPEEGPTV